jgi:hypothetical protein
MRGTAVIDVLWNKFFENMESRIVVQGYKYE